MLVLSRKAGEQIRVGDDVVITIGRIKGNRVQVLLEAPADVLIRRTELGPEIRKEVTHASA
jgi:carbon storage regulator